MPPIRRQRQRQPVGYGGAIGYKRPPDGHLPSLGARSSVVEHLTFNQGVDGSIPSGLTIVFKGLANLASTAL